MADSSTGWQGGVVHSARTRTGPIPALWLVLFAAMDTGAACRGARAQPGHAPPPVHRERLAVAENGLSGLDRDETGALWAVAERDRVLVRIEGPRVRTVPLVGVPAGLDCESLAWLGGGRAALGTESQVTGRAEDLVLVVEVGSQARVVETIPVPYAGLGIPAVENHGVEGLCRAGGKLVAAMETVDERHHHRRAVVLRRPVGGGEWTVFRVDLTSETGKLAGLDCRVRGDRIEVLAIERHYEVARLVTFALPLEGPGRRVRARLWEDLYDRFPDHPNLEGVTASDGGVDLVVDNHGGGQRVGPNELIRLARRW